MTHRAAVFVGIGALCLASAGVVTFGAPETATGVSTTTYVLPNPHARCRLHFHKKLVTLVEYKRVRIDGKRVVRRVLVLQGECHDLGSPTSSISRVSGDTNTQPTSPTTSVPTTTTTTQPSSEGFDPQLTSQWAGYFETPGDVSSVSATWVVPYLDCSSTETLSSTWVGVGGISGGVLLQAGMFDDCVGGVSENGAFAEEYPGSIANFDLAFSPGDTVTASVSDGASGWRAEVTDVTTGQTEAASAPGYAGGGSAEWMVEAYGAPGGVPVSDFGSEQLSAFTVSGEAASIPPSDVWEMSNVSASDPATGVYRLTYG
jgi:hypothetical protein